MKLVEINLVMGIVKIALMVLALVFSACPLPFESVATPEFLTWWWMGGWGLVSPSFGLLSCRDGWLRICSFGGRTSLCEEVG